MALLADPFHLTRLAVIVVVALKFMTRQDLPAPLAGIGLDDGAATYRCLQRVPCAVLGLFDAYPLRVTIVYVVH